MTEKEWSGCANPDSMLVFLRDRASDRKLRLFAAACCRRVWRLFPDERSRRSVELAEGYTDGNVSDEQLMAACETAMQAADVSYGEWKPIHGAYRHAAQAAWWMGGTDQPFDAGYVAERCYGASVCDPDDPEVEEQAQAELLRDIFGNPVRPVAFDPRWRSADAVGLARGINEDRAFDRMPLLADALMDAGCDSYRIRLMCNPLQGWEGFHEATACC